LCVSAETSFGLTGVLIPVGIYCLKSAAQRDRSALLGAAIPLLFGVQQLCEGLVWVGIGRGDAEFARSAALGYLFFALAFWLFWIPFSAVFLEPRARIKIILRLSALLGSLGGAVLYLPVILNPAALRTILIHHSIHYDYADPPALIMAPQVVWHMFYVAIVAMPLVFLRNKTLIWFSTALVASAAISHVYYLYAFASNWCFFTALLSFYLGYLFHAWPVGRSSGKPRTADDGRDMQLDRGVRPT
jgi:hypothetical protein